MCCFSYKTRRHDIYNKFKDFMDDMKPSEDDA